MSRLYQTQSHLIYTTLVNRGVSDPFKFDVVNDEMELAPEVVEAAPERVEDTFSASS